MLFHQKTISDGLPNNLINCIFSDYHQNLWIGTDGGIAKYDGLIFEKFDSKVKNSTPKGEQINCITELDSNNILCGTNNGLNIYSKNNRNWRYIDKDTFGNTLPKSALNNIFVLDGKIFLCYTGQDLVVYNPLYKRFDIFEWKQFASKFFDKEFKTINHILLKSKTELWLATNLGLFSFNLETKSFSFHPHENKQPKDLYKILKKGDNLWIAGYSLRKFNITHNKWENYNLPKIDIKRFNHLQFCKSIAFLNDSIILYGGAVGLWKFNIYNKKFTPVVSKENQLVFSDFMINSFCQNQEHLWVATNGGLLYSNRQYEAFNIEDIRHITNWQNIGEIFFVPQKITVNEKAYYLTMPKKGDLIKVENNRIKTIYFNKNIDNQIIGFFRLDNLIYVYSQSKLFIISQLVDKLELQYDFDKQFSNLVITSITYDRNQNLWIGTLNQGLIKYDLTKKIASKIPVIEKQFKNLNVICISSYENEIFIGTQGNGLIIYNTSENSVQNFTNESETASYIPDYNILSLQVYKNNIQVTTKNNGLIKLKKSKDKWIYGEDNSLIKYLPSTIYCTNLSSRGRFWYSSQKGIATIDSKEQILIEYDNTFGIGKQGGFEAIVEQSDSNFTFCSKENFVDINTNLLSFQPQTLNLQLKDIKVNDKSIDYKNIYEYKYNQNYFTFDFALNEYLTPHKIVYTYILEGLEKEWQILNYNNRSIRFPSLAAGSYTLRLKATSTDQSKISNEIIYHFNISPPFWKTWWFLLCSILLLLTIVIAYFIVREKKIKAAEEEKSRINKVIAELEIRALRAQMNPHFIFNSLNSIQHSIAKQDFETAYLYLNKFSKLLRLVLNYSEKNYLTIEQEITILTLYLEIEKMRFGNSFEYKINVDESIDEEFIEIPSLLIQPFVENSIWHGLMLKAENRKIEISFEVKIENILLVTIYDNGIGRKKAAEIKSKQIKAQDHQSKGMKLSQERLEIIQHQTNQIASIEIEDLVDEYDQALGTKVLITLPILN